MNSFCHESYCDVLCCGVNYCDYCGFNIERKTIIFFLFEDKNSEEISSSLMSFAASH